MYVYICILLYYKLLFGYLMYIQRYISSNIAQNGKLPICCADPPNLKLGEGLQDLSQSHWNFHTLLIMYRDSFPSKKFFHCTLLCSL